MFSDRHGMMGIVDYATKDDLKYALRKLDDTEFRNPFEKCYIRVKEDTRGGEPRGRSRSRSRSRSRTRRRAPRPSGRACPARGVLLPWRCVNEGRAWCCSCGRVRESLALYARTLCWCGASHQSMFAWGLCSRRLTSQGYAH